MAKPLAWLKALGKKTLSRRAILVLCGVWCLAMLLPLFAISFSAHPVHDDFPHTQATTEAWMRTGSFWETVKAAAEYTVHLYQSWQGTFAAMFVSAFQPMVFGPELFALTPILTLAGLCLSAAYFSKALICRTLKGDASLRAVFFTVLLTMLLQFLPSAREVIYWHSGTPYTWSVTLLLVMLGLLLKLREKGLSSWPAVRRSAMLFVCGALLGGCPYPLALGGVVGFLLIALWAFWARSPARWGSLCAFAGTALGLAVVVMAPGNQVRQAGIGAPMAPLQAIVQGVAECMQMTGTWFSPQLVGAAILLCPLLSPVLKESGLSFRRPVWFSAASFGVLAASFVPPIYATGVEGYQVERVLSSLYMLYVLLLLVNLLYWTGFAQRRLEAKKPGPGPFAHKGLNVGALALSLMFLLWGLFANAIMATPSISAARSLLTGEATLYDQEVAQREAEIAASESKEEAVSAILTLTAEPVVLPRDMLVYQKEKLGSTPLMMRRYFRMQALAREYGPGNIPESEWEKLDS